MAIAKKNGDATKVEHLHWQKQQDEIDVYEWEEIQYSRRLVGRARELRVPVPPRPYKYDEESDYWRVSQIHGEWFLTQAGITTIRESIRTEERWLRERRAHYLAWIAPIIGLIGAVTGLLAVLRTFKLI